MVDKRTSALSAIGTLADGDLIAVEDITDTAEDKKTTLLEIAQYLEGVIQNLPYIGQVATSPTFWHILHEHFDAVPTRRMLIGRWVAAKWTFLPTNDADGSNDFGRELAYEYADRQWLVKGPFQAGDPVADTDVVTKQWGIANLLDVAQAAAEATAAADATAKADAAEAAAASDATTKADAAESAAKTYADTQSATWLGIVPKTAPATIALSELGKLITTDSDITIPDNASRAFAIGSKVGLLATSGTPNILDSAGVTLNNETTGAASIPMVLNRVMIASKIGTDEWNITDANPLTGSKAQTTLTTLAANGAVNIDWSQNDHHQIDTAGFDITSMTESNGPTAGSIIEGTLHIKNSGGTDSVVDTTGLDHGLATTFNVVAGGSEVIQMWSTV